MNVEVLRDGQPSMEADVNLASLPPEVLVHLLSFLRPWDLCSVCMVCRTLSVAGSDEALWRPFGHPGWAPKHVAEYAGWLESLFGSSGKRLMMNVHLSMTVMMMTLRWMCVSRQDGWKGAYLLWLRTALQQCIASQGPSVSIQSRKHSDYDHLFKFLLVGKGNVGKSCLLSRFVADAFIKSYIPTVGVDFNVKIADHKSSRAKMQIWDTAGQEQYRTIPRAYYKGAHSIYVVYDMTDRASFDDAEYYRREIMTYGKEDVKVVLIANKKDVQSRTVSEEEGRDLARKWGVPYVECSAKTGEGVQEAFLVAVGLLLVGKWQHVQGMESPALLPDESTMQELAALAQSKRDTMRKQASQTKCSLQ